MDLSDICASTYTVPVQAEPVEIGKMRKYDVSELPDYFLLGDEVIAQIQTAITDIKNSREKSAGY